MDSTEEIQFEHEFVAHDDTAAGIARAVVASAYRRRSTKWWILGSLVAQTVIYSFGYDDERVGAVILSALFWAALVTLALALLVAVLAYLSNRRVLRRTVRPGGVMRTGFGERGFITANDLSSSRFSYRAVEQVTSHRGYVLVRYVGHPLVRVYPQSLFPPEALERIRSAARKDDLDGVGKG